MSEFVLYPCETLTTARASVSEQALTIVTQILKEGEVNETN